MLVTFLSKLAPASRRPYIAFSNLYTFPSTEMYTFLINGL